ncbi:MAG: neutral/alkaline non-lysosomal ceramidase N-terminal domain-containing protein [Cyclobacteriaceae bacterium]
MTMMSFTSIHSSLKKIITRTRVRMDSLQFPLLPLLFVFALLLPGWSPAQSTSGGKFRASVVKVDITPLDSQMLAGYDARKSTGVMHRIYHRIVAMDDGTTQFFLISTDIGKMSPSQYDKVAAKLEREHGIDPVNLWWTVTHTHSAPEIGPPGISGIFLPNRYQHAVASEYTKVAEQKLIDGIIEARRKLQPARLGVGWGFSRANINRRAIDVDGKASLGLSPEGPVDRMIGLLRLENQDGSPMALIANYALHGTVLGPQNLHISGDAPGIVADYVEEQIGVPMLFINGAAGNLAPIYSVYPDARQGHLGQFRVLLGDRILEANQAIAQTTKEVSLVSRGVIVETPRKEMGWPADMPNYSRTTASGQNMVLLPVRFLKINDDVAIWSAPLELFCEISSTVREHSPFPYTFYFGYGNGNLGYMPTSDGWGQGGYEPSVSPFTPAAEKDLTEAVIGYLQGELRAPVLLINKK